MKDVKSKKRWDGQFFNNSLPEANSSHLKQWGWKMSFLLERPPVRCYVSFWECSLPAKFCRGKAEPDRT